MGKNLNITWSDIQNTQWKVYHNENMLTIPMFDHLRAAAAQAIRESENVYYFPSYEIAAALGKETYTPETGRHVKENIVYTITNIFMQSHSAGKIAAK